MSVHPALSIPDMQLWCIRLYKKRERERARNSALKAQNDQLIQENQSLKAQNDQLTQQNNEANDLLRDLFQELQQSQKECGDMQRLLDETLKPNAGGS
jgi:uncharacterized protein involved in exopolysaccharide biosynthesis